MRCKSWNSAHKCACTNRLCSPLATKAEDLIEHFTSTREHNVHKLRIVLISHLHTTFMQSFDRFDKKSTHNTSLANRRLALREYVKARTSHLAATNGWKDVAVLHKRIGEGANKAEKEKYTQIAHLCYAEWGLGSHEEMEKTGQIYGPAVPGYSFGKGLGGIEEKGGHTWAVNAAWLLGHLHARHRFIQVVPVTKDNAMRGSKGGEYGALFYESALIRAVAGMRLGRASGPWAEYLPGPCSHHTGLEDLSQNAIDDLTKFPFAPNISMDDVVKATKKFCVARGSAEQFPYEQYSTWQDGHKVKKWRYSNHQAR